MKSRVGLALLSLLLLLPLLAGAAIAALNQWTPTQVAASAPEPAPVQEKPANLADARRAAGEAQTQAGFMVSGAHKLKEGTSQLATNAPQLADGTRKAADGATQLRDGMVKLQAGTGQLGEGATKLADGVGTAVDNIVGVDVVRGQIITAIDSALVGLDGNTTPEAKDARATLKQLRERAETFELGPELTGQLREMKEGSRELANQLNTPGYAYHDGIYTATKGSRQLAEGLAKLNAGVDDALAGVKELDEGAGKIDTLANNTKDKVDAAAKAAAGTDVAGTDAAGTDAAANQAPTSAAPIPAAPAGAALLAVVLAALVLLGGVGASAGFGALTGSRAWALAVLLGVGSVLAGLVGVFLTSAPLSGQQWGIIVAALIATVIAAAAGTRLGQLVFGNLAGFGVAVALGIGQLGLVGWMWKLSLTHELTSDSWFAGHLLPLNWTAVALDGAPDSYAWTSLGVLGALALCGAIVAGVGSRAAVREKPGQSEL